MSDNISASDVYYRLGEMHQSIKNMDGHILRLDDKDKEQDDILENHENRILSLENVNENKQVEKSLVKRFSKTTWGIITGLILVSGFLIDKAYKMTNTDNQEKIQKLEIENDMLKGGKHGET